MGGCISLQEGQEAGMGNNDAWVYITRLRGSRQNRGMLIVYMPNGCLLQQGRPYLTRGHMLETLGLGAG